ncbi:hypothetical protein SAMN02745181_2927 [Rubritalea squalenifaciens DSM 18772]|uniref:Uncharacterized protein n=1 Tax=Rubritalea squalenifaciens DSM 18772 TaxID=1123071 RepID=A0A1M6NQA9_9BACT|nr:hypothetical protein [Rubritalea squalenifaciens]SHJ97796.1 hypothetical protein SAMN02745181_2927 [Rubritalea squalenifaciens DSM 18772]
MATHMTNSTNYPDNTYTENRTISSLVAQVTEQETEAKSNSLPKLFVVLSVITLAAFIAYIFSIDPPYISAFSSSALMVTGIILARKDKKVNTPKKVTHHCGCCNSPLVEETHNSKKFLVCHWCREFGEKNS